MLRGCVLKVGHSAYSRFLSASCFPALLARAPRRLIVCPAAAPRRHAIQHSSPRTGFTLSWPEILQAALAAATSQLERRSMTSATSLKSVRLQLRFGCTIQRSDPLFLANTHPRSQPTASAHSARLRSCLPGQTVLPKPVLIAHPDSGSHPSRGVLSH
jgi:hypothetical protein